MPFLGKTFIGYLIISTFSFAAEALTKIEGCVRVPTNWADGDSFLVRTPGGQEVTIRLYGADCLEWHVTDTTDTRRLRAQRSYFGISKIYSNPRKSIELAKGYGEAAADFIAERLTKPFTIYTAFSDARGDGKHKRVYGFVIDGDGQDLSAALVSAGLARAYGFARVTYDNRSREEYREWLSDLELQAAKAGRGIWKDTNWEQLPNERRKQRIEDSEVELALGNAPLLDGEKFNLNSAARDELMRLPGIGETMANRIIEHRPNKGLDNLLEVPGIGSVTLAKIRPYLKLEE